MLLVYQYVDIDKCLILNLEKKNEGVIKLFNICSKENYYF